MKLVNVKLITLLLVSYCFALIILTPLQWLMPMVEPRLAAIGISVSEVEGSIWDGRGIVQMKPYGYATVSWDVQASGLLLLKAPIKVTIKNSDMDINGQIAVSPFGIALSDLNGFVDEKTFKSIYSAYNASISGRLQLDSVSADMSWSKKLGDAHGDLTWSGGPVSIPVGRSKQNYDVPTMFANINSDEEKWFVSVVDEGKAELFAADLTREGVGTFAVKAKLAEVMKIPLPNMGENIYKLSQQVL